MIGTKRRLTKRSSGREKTAPLSLDVRLKRMELKGDNEQLLVIERSTFGEPGTPGDEDLLLNISVRVKGYSAEDQAWVVSNDWRTFTSEFRKLEERRKGQAILKGASDRDLELIFEAKDAAGHMAVSGFLSWDTPDGFTQKMQFGFDFDASMMMSLVREFEDLGR